MIEPAEPILPNDYESVHVTLSPGFETIRVEAALVAAKLGHSALECLGSVVDIPGESEGLKQKRIEEYDLTPRQREILGLMGQGLTREEITQRLSLSHDTLKTHVRNIYKKTGARNEVEAMGLDFTLIESYELNLKAAHVGGLTPRRRKVLELLATGLSNPEIASGLEIDIETVRSHISRGIYPILGVDRRVKAAYVYLARQEMLSRHKKIVAIQRAIKLFVEAEKTLSALSVEEQEQS